MDMAAWLLGSITVYNFETKYHWGYYWPGLVNICQVDSEEKIF
jgi:hypothetical protein